MPSAPSLRVSPVFGWKPSTPLILTWNCSGPSPSRPTGRMSMSGSPKMRDRSPLVHASAKAVDELHQLVLLALGRELARFLVEDDLTLALLLRPRDGAQERCASPFVADLAGWLAARVEFPVPGRVLVRGVRDGLFEEGVAHVSGAGSLPTGFGELEVRFRGAGSVPGPGLSGIDGCRRAVVRTPCRTADRTSRDQGCGSAACASQCRRAVWPSTPANSSLCTREKAYLFVLLPRSRGSTGSGLFPPCRGSLRLRRSLPSCGAGLCRRRRRVTRRTLPDRGSYPPAATRQGD